MTAPGPSPYELRAKLVLRALRATRLNLSARDLGKMLGVTGAYISAIEDPENSRFPSLDLLGRYAGAFGLRPSDVYAAAEKLGQPDYRQALRLALDITEPENQDRE